MPAAGARQFFQDFFRTEAASGLVLLVAAVVALAAANSPWAPAYDAFWQTRLVAGPEAHPLSLTAQQWVNDALMAVFFLLVGLEIKRELLVGELSTPPPGGAALRRRAGRRRGAGPPLPGARPGRGARRLGDSDGHRHRLRAGRAGAGGARRAGRAQGVPRRAGDRRRHGRGAGDRPLLHRGGATGPRSAARPWRCWRSDRREPARRAGTGHLRRAWAWCCGSSCTSPASTRPWPA